MNTPRREARGAASWCTDQPDTESNDECPPVHGSITSFRLCGPTNERDYFPVPSQARCGIRQQSATMGSPASHQLTRKGKPMAIVHVGIDLAKNIFALHE